MAPVQLYHMVMRINVLADPVMVHKNPIVSGGDFMYEPDPLDTYDPQVEARMCDLQHSKMLAWINKSDWPLLHWMDGYCQEALLEMMRLEGQGDCATLTRCPSCSKPVGVAGAALYHCKECLGTKMECDGCILRQHAQLPFHIIQHWNGSSFHKVTLQSLGFQSTKDLHELLLARTVLSAVWVGKSHVTDATGISKPKMLKVAGHGNVNDGIKMMPQGGLALLCLACPHPRINLLSDWESAPLEYKYDPGLHMGLAYFIKPGPYLAYVMGVGMCICVHHEMVQLLSIGDLQKEEWYCNMDYIVLSAAQNHGVKSIFFSYDIACQWKLNFFECMIAFECAEEYKAIDIKFRIPKCHCKGHKLKCQCYHVMQIQIISQTDGEGINTKEMGLRNRWDKLDVQFARHNWHKTARQKAAKHMLAYLELTEVLSKEHFKTEWKEKVKAWEKNQSLLSPYFIEVKCSSAEMTEAQVALALKEDERLTALNDRVEIDNSMATVCIKMGLAVEDMQHHLLEDIKDNKETIGATKDIQNKRITVHKHLHQLHNLQSEFMPYVKVLLQWTMGESRDVEHHWLWLPSELELILHEKGCLESLRELKAGDITSLHGSVLEIDEAEEDELVGPSQKRWKTAKEVGEGHQEILWIWIQEGALGDGQDEKLSQAVKLKWLKSQARAHHWREECLLLTEEKRWMLESFRFTAEQWDNRESSWEGLDVVMQEELHFRKLWDMPIEEVLESEKDSETEMEDDGQGDRNHVEECFDAVELEG
ncbi:hypothetical protein ARMSODRAFT_979742 [Armillaria solidipes]|uniref:CxC2-like cysteine cluster KDZ transposase-associated domain-containing protein n=1 Tax=Armillaria solidipes TaxID=1076256 RepID=A0A2H3BIB5_9AGAR|nr:hypothetical protein ARMSODRAFT_979742 [Armillaria solidipes]